jgi:hypothetical protein
MIHTRDEGNNNGEIEIDRVEEVEMTLSKDQKNTKSKSERKESEDIAGYEGILHTNETIYTND